jgi:hypothetical protein
VRDGRKFVEYQEIQPQIRAIEMEAAGMVQALQDGHRQQAWLVVRGISDFGDTEKDKFLDMQPYASASAAAYVRLFAERGFVRRILVGESPPTTPGSTSPLPAAPTATYGTTLTAFSATTNYPQVAATGSQLAQELDKLRTEWVKIPKAVGADRVRALRTQSYWATASPEVQGRVIRFEAELVLSVNNDVSLAQQLLREADQLAGPSPAFEARLQAAQGDSLGAAGRLVPPKTLQEWNLRMALLLEAGQPQEMQEQFNNPPDGVGPDPESHRLRALAFVMTKQLDTAEAALAKARTKKPDAFAVRFAGALLDYYRAFSPATLSAAFQLRPLPVPTAFIKRDSDSLAALERAEKELAALATLAPESDLQHQLEVWRLAALSNHAGRQSEASQLCQTMLAKSPTDALVLQWVSERGYNLDSSQNIEALAAELDIKL